jgi:hypothetical protein
MDGFSVAANVSKQTQTGPDRYMILVMNASGQCSGRGLLLRRRIYYHHRSRHADARR